MNTNNIQTYSGNFLINAEFAPSGHGNHYQTDEGPDALTPSNMPGRQHEKEFLSKEREKELEDWMIQVKSFIRNIDVSKL